MVGTLGTADTGGTAQVIPIGVNPATGAMYVQDLAMNDVVYVDDADWTNSTSKHLLVGGLYQSTPQTVTDGDVAPFEIDSNGNVKSILATAIAGEDLTNDVLKTEQRFSGSMVSADTLIKSGAGFLHSLTFACIDAAPTAGTIIVYDNTAESGTILYSETFDTTVFRGYSVILDLVFSVGLYIGFTTTADIGVTPSYR